MSLRDSGIVANFTEDAPSLKATKCGRTDCGAIIQAGEDRHYIHGYNSKSGKEVCTNCVSYYNSKPDTMSRKDFVGLSSSDRDSVRASVLAARKKGNLEPLFTR
ncbi:hypothetical protein R3P38DRAFT_2786418 [Favolaschia claudopus]|uniref:Uncharacterized protein n=1 Tax=Favolaschia claudopus TaxID=2862362 RepID=A0AAW0AV79_9AGAR